MLKALNLHPLTLKLVLVFPLNVLCCRSTTCIMYSIGFWKHVACTIFPRIDRALEKSEQAG